MTRDEGGSVGRHTVREATVAEVTELAGVLRDAFVDYPWTRWTIPEQDHERRLESVQRAYLTHAMAHGGRIWATADLAAVAAFVPARMPDPTPDLVEQIVAAHGDRLDRLAAHESRAAGVRPDHDWVLATVGVRRGSRGRGAGSAVLRVGLDDLAGQRVLLETSEVTNVRFYEHLGFELVGEVLGDGPPVWVMLR